MQTILKFDLKIDDVQIIELPRGAEILCVQMQNGYPGLWVKADLDFEKQPVEIFMYGTGHEVPINKKYIGTFQESIFVWHVFE